MRPPTSNLLRPYHSSITSNNSNFTASTPIRLFSSVRSPSYPRTRSSTTTLRYQAASSSWSLPANPFPSSGHRFHTNTTAAKMSAVETKATIASFGGKLLKLSHKSTTTGTDMAFNVYLPPQASSTAVPLLIYLSGLTCTPENATEKAFLQSTASQRGVALLLPDTSPRGLDIAGANDSYDFGEAASFYIDAKKDPYATNYKMETYLTQELPEVVFKEFQGKIDSSRVSITGHSMGGHGALTLYLKNPGKYKSVSAFAPICNPTQCPWGEKAFSGYLGDDREEWKKHDATELVKSWKGPLNALIDVGTGDNFYKQGQLLPENFEKAVKEAGVEGVEVRYQQDYDHSYFFMASFQHDHVNHAAKFLGAYTTTPNILPTPTAPRSSHL